MDGAYARSWCRDAAPRWLRRVSRPGALRLGRFRRRAPVATTHRRPPDRCRRDPTRGHATHRPRRFGALDTIVARDLALPECRPDTGDRACFVVVPPQLRPRFPRPGAARLDPR